MLKKYSRKRSTYSRKGKRQSVKKVVYSILKKKIEMKHATSSFDWSNIPTYAILAGTGTYFCNLIQGTADGQRIGNRVSPKKLHVNFAFRMPDNAATSNALIRVIFYRERSAGVSETTIIPSAYGPVDLDYADIMLDRWVSIGSGGQFGANAVGGQVKTLRKTFRLKHTLRYNDNTSAAPTENAVKMIVVADGAVVNSQIAGYWRMGYQDA